MKKITANCVVVGIIVVLLFIIIMIVKISMSGALFFPMKYENAEKNFKANKEKMFVIRDYFLNSEFSEIYISSSMESNIMYADGRDMIIKNVQVVRAIEDLKKHDCEVIEKNGNTISFQIWSDLDSGHGVVFSTEGTKPTLQFLTKLEKLNEDNWYYYEEDFNEWKLKNE